MKKFIVIMIAIVLVGAIAFRLTCNYKAIKSKNNTSHEIAVPAAVSVVNVKQMTSSGSLDLIGTLKAWKEVTIAAETQGKIVELNIEAGQIKLKGDVVAVIDDKMKQLAAENATVNLSKIKIDFDRIDNLFKCGSSSKQQLDDAARSYESAKNQLDQTKKQLADATVTSPISGIITKKSVELGSYINMGSPIATIVDISKLKVALQVSEANVYRLIINDTAIVTTDVYPGISYTGRISYISGQGDDTHNYPVEIAMDNNAHYPLKAGTFANVHIAIKDSQKRLYIPRQALVGSTKEAYVYIVDKKKAIKRPIIVGSENGEYLEVVSGISINDLVVISGQLNLFDQKPVFIAKN